MTSSAARYRPFRSFSAPICFALTLASLMFLVRATTADAGDWPQILGPTRDGVAVKERLVDKFAASGPKTVWQRPVGSGFAGVAVAAGKVILFHRVDDDEWIEAMDTATGEVLWKTDFPSQYGGGISEDSGPRCVPLIHRGNVYVFGAAGNLHSVTLDKGTKRWSRAANKEFGAPDGYFGAGSTPIIEGDKLLVNVGARGAGIVAFSLDDGSTVWQATSEQASYSSPVTATFDGVRQVVFITRLSTLSLDPETGKVHFQFPFGQRGPTVNAASPLVIDHGVFVSASYGIGAAFAKIGPKGDSAEIVWSNDSVMSSQYSTCVLHDGALFGVDGRQDGGPTRLRCFDPLTGKVHWTKEDFGVATLILADGKLVALKTDGQLVLVAASTKKYTPLGTASLFRDTVRALPALSNGLLYARDTKALKCVQIGAAP